MLREHPSTWRNLPTHRNGEYRFCQNCANLVYRAAHYAKREYKSVFCSKRCEGEWRTGQRNTFYGKKHTEASIKKILAAVHAKPNKAEKRLIEIFERNNLPYRFVGDGSLIIDGMNPDFVSTINPKLLVEMFGVYWHKEKAGIRFRNTEEGKVAVYENLGYRCAIIWETDSEEQILSKMRSLEEGKVMIG